MANYPDWVMKHKKKGTYINRVGDRYYLYAAHSERVKGTNKVRRVSDGYLGRITEKEGLIPPQSKISNGFLSYEFGLSYAVLSCSKKIHSGLSKSFVKHGNLVYSCSILSFIYGDYNRELFERSYLSIHFSDTSYPSSFTKPQLTGIERGKKMLEDTLGNLWGDDLLFMKASFSLLTLVRIKHYCYCSEIPDSVKLYCEKYNIRLEDALWQK